MRKLTDITIAFLQVQIGAGAAAVQLFDSWAGAVSPEDYRQSVLAAQQPDLRRAGRHRGAAAALRRETPASCSGMLGGGRRRRGRGGLAGAARRGGPPGRPGQGAAGQSRPGHPAAPWDVVERRAIGVRTRAARPRATSFNLGHGVLPETDPGVLARLAELVHSASCLEPS